LFCFSIRKSIFFNTQKVPYTHITIYLQDGTTYYVGEEGKSGNAPPPLTLNTGMVRRSSLSPKRAKGDIPKSPVLSFRKETDGNTTFRIAQVRHSD
jgi:hypothetical protein